MVSTVNLLAGVDRVGARRQRSAWVGRRDAPRSDAALRARLRSRDAELHVRGESALRVDARNRERVSRSVPARAAGALRDRPGSERGAACAGSSARAAGVAAGEAVARRARVRRRTARTSRTACSACCRIRRRELLELKDSLALTDSQVVKLTALRDSAAASYAAIGDSIRAAVTKAGRTQIPRGSLPRCARSSRRGARCRDRRAAAGADDPDAGAVGEGAGANQISGCGQARPRRGRAVITRGGSLAERGDLDLRLAIQPVVHGHAPRLAAHLAVLDVVLVRAAARDRA